MVAQLYVSFAEYGFFYRALVQKRLIRALLQKSLIRQVAKGGGSDFGEHLSFTI